MFVVFGHFAPEWEPSQARPELGSTSASRRLKCCNGQHTRNTTWKQYKTSKACLRTQLLVRRLNISQPPGVVPRHPQAAAQQLGYPLLAAQRQQDLQ